MYQISNFPFYRMNNAEFLAFFVNLAKVLGEVSSTNIGLTEEQSKVFDDLLTRLTDQVYTTQGSEFTAKMQEADDRRSAIYKRILTKLGVVNYAESDRDLNAIKETVKTQFLSRYKMQVGSIAQQERTAIISGFIFDLKGLSEDAMEVLGIYSDVVSLEGANNAFIASYNSRNVQRVEVEKGLTTNCRKQLTEFFLLSSFQIQYNANQPAEGDDADKVRGCIDYVQRVNGLLEDARIRLNQRLKKEGESAEESGDGGGGNSQSATGEDSPGTGAGSGNGGSGGTGGNGGSGGQTVDPGSGAIIDGDMAIL